MPHVVVIGGANVDIKGRASAPYVPATSNPGEVTISAGGVGRNIADNLSRLGVGVSLLTALGDDANGQFLRRACGAAGIDISLALTADEATGTYLAILDEAGEMVSAVSDMRAIERLEPAALAAVAVRLSAADMLVADCNISVDCLAWLCAFSARSGVPLLIEPVSVPKAMKLLEFERKAPVFAITPNARQLGMLAGGETARLHALGFSNIVVHMGAEGCPCFRRGPDGPRRARPRSGHCRCDRGRRCSRGGPCLGIAGGLSPAQGSPAWAMRCGHQARIISVGGVGADP